MPRGIREVKHTRVLFGDLGYSPDANPYKPDGIRKMSDTWVDPDGDGYVSMFPGYTSLVTIESTEIHGLALTKHGETVNYWAYTEDTQLNLEMWRLTGLDGTNTITATLKLTFTGGGGGQQFAGKIPVYSFIDENTDRAYFFSGTGGSTTAIGGYYDNSDSSTGTIGLERPNITTGDDTGASASSALNAAGGAVKGIVKYFISYTGQDGTDEGALSLEFGEIDAGDGYSITLANLPTKSTNKARLYRTFSDGNQPFYLATLDTTVTDYEDNIADVDLGDLPLKMGDPPDAVYSYTAATWHYGRAYILGNKTSGSSSIQRIFFSDPEEPESFYTSQFGNWFDITDGSPTKALLRTASGLVILKARAAYFLSGRTPADLTLQEIVPQSNPTFSLGCGAPGGAVETPNGVFFYDFLNNSVWQFGGGGGLQNISEGIRINIKDNTVGVSAANEYDEVTHVGYNPAKNVVVLSNNRSSDPRMWAYDTSSGKWIGAASYAPRSTLSVTDQQGSGDNEFGMLCSLGGSDPNVYRMFSGTDHNGTAISSPTVGSPTFTGSDPTLEKTFLYVDVLMKGEASKSVAVNWFIDGATTADGTATVTLTGTDARERHRVNIGERGRELDIDVVLDNSSVDHGIYGIVYGYTEDTSVVGS